MVTVSAAQLYLLLNSFFWPFVRLLALFSTAPIIYDPSVPARVKIALAAACALLIAPTLAMPASTETPFSGEGLILLLQQILIGAGMGIGMRLIFAAVELAGDAIGLQMGLSFATFMDPQNADDAPIVGSFLGIIASLILLSINGHLLIIAALIDSFNTIPISAHMDVAPTLMRLVALGGEIFRIGLHLSLPVLSTMLVLNLALGVLSRTAPQLNVFAIGFPVTLLLGMLLLGLSLPYMGAAMERLLQQSIVTIAG
jgi:flagellar biosynthesis protein FliR